MNALNKERKLSITLKADKRTQPLLRRINKVCRLIKFWRNFSTIYIRLMLTHQSFPGLNVVRFSHQALSIGLKSGPARAIHSKRKSVVANMVMACCRPSSDSISRCQPSGKGCSWRPLTFFRVAWDAKSRGQKASGKTKRTISSVK